MEHQLEILEGYLVISPATVDFIGYEDMLNQAKELAAKVQEVEVNEENVKHSKKLVAAINKEVKELEARRIAVKRSILEPYQVFENQVKEIVNTVKTADSVVREQIRELEERERQEKREQLEIIFDKRKRLYSLGDLIKLENFISPKHLNKTQPINATELEMIEFLERTERDAKVIQHLESSDKHLAAYLECFDLSEAMTKVNQEKADIERIRASKKAIKTVLNKVATTFTVYGDKEFLLVETYMQKNDIKFTILEG